MINLTEVKENNENNDFDILESQIEAYRKWGYIAGMKNEDIIISSAKNHKDNKLT